MKRSRALVVALTLSFVAGCSATRPVAPQTPPTPPRQRSITPARSPEAGPGALAGVPGLVASLTVDQVRKANADGLPFSALAPEQQAAVRALWANYAANWQTQVAAGAVAAIGPVDETRVVLVGYYEPSGPWDLPTVDLEVRQGNHRCQVLAHPDPIPAPIKEAGTDMVAARMAVPPTEEERKAMAAGEPLPPPSDN